MQNIFTKIYTWSHKYYNLRLPWYFFRNSAKLHVQSGKCSKTQNARGAWYCICSNFYFTNQLLNVPLKRKTNNILHHHTAYDHRKGWKSHWYTTARCWYMASKHFFSRECLQIPVSWWQMSQFTLNQTELIIFRLPGVSDAGIQRSVAYTDGQRNRYVFL